MKTTESTYYEILSIDRSCSLDEIKKAYRHLIKIHHPDMGGDNHSFLAIKKAYDILSDPLRRKEYDMELGSGDIYMLDENSNRVMEIVNRMRYSCDIFYLLKEIRPLMDLIRTQRDRQYFLQFSSNVAILLMNGVIEALNYEVSSGSYGVKIFRLSYSLILEIGKEIEMNTDAYLAFLRNKEDIRAGLESVIMSRANKSSIICTVLVMLVINIIIIDMAGGGAVFPLMVISCFVFDFFVWIFRGLITKVCYLSV